MPQQSYIFLNRGFSTGGIETHILRLANYLSGLDTFSNIILLAPDGELKKYLSSSIIYIPLDPLFATRVNLNRIVGILSLHPNAVLSTFDPYSRFVADLAIQQVLQLQVACIRHISGVYHPRAYFFEDDHFYHRILNSFLATLLGSHNLYYMNSECVKSHAHRLPAPAFEDPVLSIPLANPTVTWRKSKSNLLRIVSVGRLVNFKRYFFGLVQLARELQRLGQPYELHIYGDGPLKDRILELIDNYQICDSVKLFGLLPYSDFQSVVSSYDLFVGMGTAAMEAGLIGIPVILSRDSSDNQCYGYLFDVTPGFAGERSGYYKTYSTIEKVFQFISLSQGERLIVGQKCNSALQGLTLPAYLVKMNGFINRVKPTGSSNLLRSILELYFRIFHSKTWRISV